MRILASFANFRRLFPPRRARFLFRFGNRNANRGDVAELVVRGFAFRVVDVGVARARIRLRIAPAFAPAHASLPLDP